MSAFLQCDAPGCDHREDIEEILESQVGKPCPKCGASLLTREDYEVYVVRIKPMLDMMKALGIAVDPQPGSDGHRVSIHYHDGATTIREHGHN